MTFFWYDWAGYAGVLLVLSAFALMQAHKLHGNGLIYQLMNILGSIGVLLSLSFSGGPVNWPALLMQLAWITISVYGIVRGVGLRRAAREAGRAPPLG
jgi:hypothetical protein